MRKPAYKVGEKINWKKVHENEVDEGLIDLAIAWRSSFTYLIRDRQPHTWVNEEEIVGNQERRSLRDKLDNQTPLSAKAKAKAEG